MEKDKTCMEVNREWAIARNKQLVDRALERMRKSSGPKTISGRDLANLPMPELVQLTKRVVAAVREPRQKPEPVTWASLGVLAKDINSSAKSSSNAKS